MAKNTTGVGRLDELDHAYTCIAPCMQGLAEVACFAELTDPIGLWNVTTLQTLLDGFARAYKHAFACNIPAEFSSIHDAPIEFHGAVSPSYHHLTLQLSSVVLYAAFNTLLPDGEFDLEFGDTPDIAVNETNLSPLVNAFCLRNDDNFQTLTLSSVDWLEAAIDQEYCKAVCLVRYGQNTRETIQRRPRPAPRFRPPSCPKCHAQTFVQRTDDSTRYLKCIKCGHTFKKVASAGNGS